MFGGHYFSRLQCLLISSLFFWTKLTHNSSLYIIY
nr:MAG TPA: hypothetical protein [Caudoviricetes sp.]DAO43225.1 MAG TPA: hypothetical protein [Caudoviricetes sp.]